MKNIVIAYHKIWYSKLCAKLGRIHEYNFIDFTKTEDLSLENLNTLQPEYIFFPHWSTIIPKEIHESFKCVIFHMTDVPFGRGGSPLQNLISLGYKETKISALVCGAQLDAGPVYLKKSLSLFGSAEEIFLRAAALIESMISEILLIRPVPVQQSGDPVIFRRRKPSQSKLGEQESIEACFDFIRMLDADGYPQAFLHLGKIKYSFSQAHIKFGKIIAQVEITEENGFE